MKTRIAIGVAIVFALAVAAGAQDLPDRIKKAGKIVVATKPNYPPITYKDPATNQNMGVDIDLGEAGTPLGATFEGRAGGVAMIQALILWACQWQSGSVRRGWPQVSRRRSWPSGLVSRTAPGSRRGSTAAPPLIRRPGPRSVHCLESPRRRRGR